MTHQSTSGNNCSATTGLHSYLEQFKAQASQGYTNPTLILPEVVACITMNGVGFLSLLCWPCGPLLGIIDPHHTEGVPKSSLARHHSVSFPATKGNNIKTGEQFVDY